MLSYTSHHIQIIHLILFLLLQLDFPCPKTNSILVSVSPPTPTFAKRFLSLCFACFLCLLKFLSIQWLTWAIVSSTISSFSHSYSSILEEWMKHWISCLKIWGWCHPFPCRPQRKTKTLKYWTVVTVAELSIHFLFKMMPSPDLFDNMLASSVGVWHHGQYWTWGFGNYRVGWAAWALL